MKTIKRNILGPKIKFYRKKQGLTQEDLAARLHIQGFDMDRSSISKIENQTRELYDYEIVAFANSLRINIQDLF